MAQLSPVPKGDISGTTSPHVLSTSGIETPGELGEPAEGAAAFEQIASNKTESRSQSPFTISTSEDIDGLINRAVLMGNFEAAVELCLHVERWAEAIILAIAGGPELLARTQKRYFRENKENGARLISSVVSGNWTSVIQNCDLDNWREALAVALTYTQSEDLVQLCDMLGTRLEIERHGELATNAALCYVCSGNVEKLVRCWARLHENNNTPESLQDLVEKVMILRKAVEMTSGQAPEMTTGVLPEKLAFYAQMLAGQGSLLTALNYLGNTNEPSLLVLRDRLYQALGNGAAGLPVPTCPYQKTNIPAAVKPAAVQPAQKPLYHTTQQQPQPQVGSGYQAQARSNFETTTTSSYQTSQGYSYNTQPQIYQPTVSSQTSSSVPSTYSRGPLAHKYPTAGGTYGLDTYSQPNYVQPDPYTQTSTYNNTGYNQPTSTPNLYNPSGSIPGGPTSSAPVYQQPNVPSVPSYQENRPDNAWNDPPPLHHHERKPNQQPKTYEAQNPITAPLYDPTQHQEQVPPGAPMGHVQPHVYNPHDYQTQPGQHIPQQVDNRTVQKIQQAQPEPPKPVQKGPIPAEHQVLYDTFDKLVNSCLGASPNPHSKRKLEDVARKLETLYDKIRDQSLSPSVTNGLHQIVQAIQGYDYQSGLGVHTQMVSQGNFSEISSFMPGVKVLLQTAAHMNVFLQ